jgi:outer membrane protein
MKTKFLLGRCPALTLLARRLGQSAGSIVVYGGAVQISPQVDSGDLTAPSLAGTKIDVKKASPFVGGITYYWTDNISIDLPISLPFKHDVVGAGAIEGVGKLGTVKSCRSRCWPSTASATPTAPSAPSSVRVSYGCFFKPKSTAALSGITGGTPATPRRCP